MASHRKRRCQATGSHGSAATLKRRMPGKPWANYKLTICFIYHYEAYKAV